MVEVLEIFFLVGGPDQGDTISVLVVLDEGSADFLGRLVHLDLAILFEQNILQVLLRGEFLAVLVGYFKGEVTQYPQELGHVPEQVLLIVMQVAVLLQNDIFGQLSHHVELGDGLLVDVAHTVEDQVGTDQVGEGEDLGVVGAVPVERGHAFRI